MKLYGKKTLSLILALSMLLSMCSFSAFAASTPNWSRVDDEDVEKVEMDAPNTIKVPVGLDVDDVSDLINDAVDIYVTLYETKISGTTYEGEYTYNKDLDWYDPWGDYEYAWELDELEYLIGEKFDFQADLYDETLEVTIQVVELEVYVDIDFSDVPTQFPLGTSEKEIIECLPTKATAIFSEDEDDDQTWTIGNDSDDELEEWYCRSFDGSEPGDYTFKTYLVSDEYELDEDSVMEIEITITDEIDDAVVNVYVNYEDYDDDPIDLVQAIVDALYSRYGLDVDTSDVTIEGTAVYGDLESDGEYTLELIEADETELAEEGKLTDELTFEAVYEYDNEETVDIVGEINVIILSGDADYSETLEEYEYDFDFGSWLLGEMEDDLGDDLCEVYLSIDEDDGGDLYADSDLTDFDDDEIYSLSELADLYFVPSGKGGDFVVDYTAYGENEDILREGKITIECPEFMLVTGTVTVGEYFEFDLEDIEDMIEDSDWDNYTLESITDLDLSVKGKGDLYYDYDPDASKNSKITSSTSSDPYTRDDFYADGSDKNADYEISKIAYVPASNATSGTVTVGFEMTLVRKNKTDEHVSAIYQISVVKPADIVITAGVKEDVTVSLDLFEEYYKDNYLSGKKGYDIAYIVFTDAPNAKLAGWLYAPNKITSPDNKKFYTGNKKDGTYDFEELSFQGAEKENVINSSFQIYGRKSSGSSTATPTVIARGTVDFVTGASQTLKFSLLASQVYNFTPLLLDLMDVGDNDNECIVFTSLPQGGKLVYNWAKDGQKDVTLNTEYYLASVTGEQLVRNITFVPNYSSSKQQQTVTFGFKGYNGKKSVDGNFNISIIYSEMSSKFTDVKVKDYADSVDFLYTQGLTNGITETTFGLYSNVNRAQFVTFLWRAAGKPAVPATVKNNFTDVKATESSGKPYYAYEAILWAVQQGITNGTSTTTFSPNSNVSHQQILAFLYRYDVEYLGHSGAGNTAAANKYIDWSQLAGDWAVKAAQWADKNGIIGDSTSIAPNAYGTRATVALWLHRMLTK